ncbi:hypothetical protein [Herbaspirillum huttiense]|uniref:hypothetical protein n=1 Tax=Herbaspirillum huttiense TaxID=863372 RepID=UPI0039AF1D83
MKLSSSINPRAPFAEAVARYLLLKRTVKVAFRRRDRDGKANLAAISRLFDAQRKAPTPEHIPVDVAVAGQRALDDVQRLNDHLDAVRSEAHRSLMTALGTLGEYFGRLMAADSHGRLVVRFERFFKKAALERFLYVDGVNLVKSRFQEMLFMPGIEDMEMLKAWSKVLGYKSSRLFVRDLRVEYEAIHGLREMSEREVLNGVSRF